MLDAFVGFGEVVVPFHFCWVGGWLGVNIIVNLIGGWVLISSD